MNNLTRSLDASLSSLVFTESMQQQVLRQIRTLQHDAAGKRRSWWRYPAIALATCMLLITAFINRAVVYLQGVGDGKYAPNSTLTGYQALAALLRLVQIFHHAAHAVLQGFCLVSGGCCSPAACQNIQLPAGGACQTLEGCLVGNFPIVLPVKIPIGIAHGFPPYLLSPVLRARGFSPVSGVFSGSGWSFSGSVLRTS